MNIISVDRSFPSAPKAKEKLTTVPLLYVNVIVCRLIAYVPASLVVFQAFEFGVLTPPPVEWVKCNESMKRIFS